MNRNKRRANRDRVADDSCQIGSWTSLKECMGSDLVTISRIQIKSNQRDKLTEIIGDAPNIPISYNEELSSPFLADIAIKTFSEDELLVALSKKTQATILIMDQVSDTRNFGAIARSAVFFGIRWIVVAQDRQAPISTATLATAQGAFAHARVATVVNISRFLDRIKKEAEFWVVGTAMDGEPLQNVVGEYKKVALIMGNEENGMRNLTRKKCDRVVSIPTREKTIDSLNVSVAAGVAMYALTSTRPVEEEK